MTRRSASNPLLSPTRVGLCVVAIILVLAAVELAMGRVLICRCGVLALWIGDTRSNQNSQQFADPYSLTHLEHGLLFFWGLRFLLVSRPLGVRLIACTVVEALWEMLEN